MSLVDVNRPAPSPPVRPRPSRWATRLAAVLNETGAGLSAYAHTLCGERAQEALEAAVVGLRAELEGPQGGAVDNLRSAIARHVRREVTDRMGEPADPACPRPGVLAASVVPGELPRPGRRQVVEHVAECAGCRTVAARITAAEPYLKARRAGTPPGWLLETLVAAPSAAKASGPPPSTPRYAAPAAASPGAVSTPPPVSRESRPGPLSAEREATSEPGPRRRRPRLPGPAIPRPPALLAALVVGATAFTGYHAATGRAPEGPAAPETPRAQPPLSVGSSEEEQAGRAENRESAAAARADRRAAAARRRAELRREQRQARRLAQRRRAARAGAARRRAAAPAAPAPQRSTPRPVPTPTAPAPLAAPAPSVPRTAPPEPRERTRPRPSPEPDPAGRRPPEDEQW